MIPKQTALLNDVPEGAYIVEVIEGSTADEAGIEAADIIVKIDGKDVKEDEGGLAALINTLKVGERVSVEVFREGETKEFEVKLKSVEE